MGLSRQYFRKGKRSCSQRPEQAGFAACDYLEERKSRQEKQYLVDSIKRE